MDTDDLDQKLSKESGESDEESEAQVGSTLR